MAGHGVYQIPREFKDEDKWFRYFTKKQAVAMFFCGLADYKLIQLTAAQNILPAGLLLSCLLTGSVAGSIMLVLPLDGFFLAGGGLTIAEWLFRKFYRRRNRCLYTRNMDEGDKNL